MNYFEGERFVGRGVVALQNGKAELQWAVYEYWDELVSCPLKCGAKYSKTLSRRRGISKTDREELEAAVRADLNILGFGGITAEIKGTLGREVTFEVEEVEEETLAWEAPTHGSLNVLMYQLVERLSLDYRDYRVFRTGSWSKTIRRRLVPYYDASRGRVNHPDCGTGPRSSAGSEEGGLRGLVLADAGLVIFLLGYRVDESGVLFPGLNLRTSKKLEVLLSRHVAFHWKDLPAAVRFFLGEEREMVRVRLRPLEGAAGAEMVHASQEELELRSLASDEPRESSQSFGVMEAGSEGMGV